MQQARWGANRQNAGQMRGLDEKDRLLLSLLRKDARSPVVALARELGLSRSATQDRLARLRDKGPITQFTIVERQAGAGGQTAHLMLRFAPGMKCAQVVPRLRQFALISAIHSVAGEVDLLIRVDTPDMAGLEALRAAIVALPGIADVTTMVTLERHLG